MRLLLAFIISSSLLAAQDIPPAYRIHSIYGCKLVGQCKTQQGTGILLRTVKGHAWFITAGHVIASNPSVEIHGRKYALTKEKSWRTRGIVLDSIVLLKTKEKIPHKSLPTYYMEEDRKPKVGDVVLMMGFTAGEYKLSLIHI